MDNLLKSAADNSTLYLSGGVGDMVMALFCHRMALVNQPVLAICAEKQFKTAVSIDDLVRRTYFPDQAAATLDAISDDEAASLFKSMSDARELDSDIGPRMLFVEDRLCVSRWVYFTRDFNTFRLGFPAWLELNAHFNCIDEISARNLFSKNDALAQRKASLRDAWEAGRPIRVNVAMHSISVPADSAILVDKVMAVLSHLCANNPVALALHQSNRGSRPEGFERKSDMFEKADRKLAACPGVATTEIIDGEFSHVIESLQQSDLFIAVRSGACDVAAVLGVPQVNFYDSLNTHRLYRHSPAETAFTLPKVSDSAVAFHNLPRELAGALKKSLA